MKETFHSWAAQKGTKVEFAADRVSGDAFVIKVLPEQRPARNRYIIEDVATKIRYEVSENEIRSRPRRFRKR